MRLKKLEIYGFKSFADRVEMTFEQGVTGVVGPNGSGKSNISDAVRWVLGEQSAKTLRGAKMEDVIFGGTEKRRRMPWCEVILVFDNEDRSLPIDFQEVAVSRRVYRNGDSEYRINAAACRLRDVVELFRDTGIGKEGYSLIGQGRIDEILSPRGEDRRDVFEEAAGIVKYKARKTEAEKRMENTRVNLSRVEDIIAELEARIEPLREQSAAAREYLALRDELKQLELNMFLQRSDRYAERTAELKQSLETLDESIALDEAAQSAASTERDQMQTELAALEAQSAAAREQVQSLIAEVEAKEGERGVLAERISSGARERERLAEQIRDAAEGGGRMAEQLETHRARAASEGAELTERTAQLAQSEAELNKTAALLVEKERQSEDIKALIIDSMNRLSDVRSEQARLTTMREALDGRIEALTAEAGDDGELLGSAQSAEADAAGRLRAEQARQRELDEELARAIAEVSACAERQERLSEELRQCTARRQEVGSRLKVLEEMQRDYEGYQHSVKQVLLRARSLPNSGVRGVVANLISVPRELERAIDMVLGAALQNVVVEREEDAKRMIDYLRAGRLGRATFLPLSAVRGRTLTREERNVLSLPGCVGLASELVSFDPAYQNIVDSLLGRTIVAKDLDSGIAIQRAGRHAFRLVTLEGDVMHSGGSMTGGSVQSRVTSLLSREREVSEHKSVLSQLTERSAALEKLRAGEADTLTAIKLRRAACYEQAHQQEIACAREEAALSSARAARAERETRRARTLAEAEKMTLQRRDVAESLEALAHRQDHAEQDTEGNRRQVALLAGEIAALRETTAALRQSVADARVSLAARERDLSALRAEIARLDRQLGDLESARASGSDQLAAARQALENDQAHRAETESALGLLRESLAERRAEFARLDGRRTEAQNRVLALSEALDKLRGSLDEFTDKRHRADMLLSRTESEFEQLGSRIWEDYELTYAGAEPFRDESVKLADADKRIAAIRARVKAMGSVNVGAVDEFRQTAERFEELTGQRDDLIKAQLDLAGIIDDLVKRMEGQFRSQFDLLNAYFQETFVKLFGGGRAELQLSDPKDVLNCSIDVVAQPPGKKLQMLSLLSGGERALTAIAILFAMLKLKPTPFCFLDEIEAALDDANIDNFADYLKTYSENTQFVVVTHRKGTMSRCDALYGITMEEKGISRIVSVKLREATAME